jgi:hypothetical protein
MRDSIQRSENQLCRNGEARDRSESGAFNNRRCFVNCRCPSVVDIAYDRNDLNERREHSRCRHCTQQHRLCTYGHTGIDSSVHLFGTDYFFGIYFFRSSANYSSNDYSCADYFCVDNFWSDNFCSDEPGTKHVEPDDFVLGGDSENHVNVSESHESRQRCDHQEEPAENNNQKEFADYHKEEDDKEAKSGLLMSQFLRSAIGPGLGQRH